MCYPFGARGSQSEKVFTNASKIKDIPKDDGTSHWPRIIATYCKRVLQSAQVAFLVRIIEYALIFLHMYYRNGGMLPKSMSSFIRIR